MCQNILDLLRKTVETRRFSSCSKNFELFQKQQRAQVARKHHISYSDLFQKRTVIADETWIFAFDTETG